MSINKELHGNEQQVLNTLDYRGAIYASNLISVFLLHECGPVRTIGLHMIDMLIKNATKYNWTPTVGNDLRNRVCSINSHVSIFSDVQRQQLLSKLGCLTGAK
ncbi:unnamed protein product [Staurois parvus]|uniref:Uncharacterized protein n=1 Tax=Staurois parvus TaxID=386267 RepID=A0ABN9E409_9NEOB|nr:unnamed protein product [Staurois parvus]